MAPNVGPESGQLDREAHAKSPTLKPVHDDVRTISLSQRQQGTRLEETL